MDNILQVEAWLADDPEHEYYKTVLSLRAVRVNAKGTIFCKFKLGSPVHHIIAIATQQRVVVLVCLQAAGDKG